MAPTGALFFGDTISEQHDVGIDNRFLVKRIAVGNSGGDTIFEYELLEPDEAEMLRESMPFIFDYYVWAIKALGALPHPTDFVEVHAGAWKFGFDRDHAYNFHLWMVSCLNNEIWDDYVLISADEYRELKDGGEMREYAFRHRK